MMDKMLAAAANAQFRGACMQYSFGTLSAFSML
jgi:hypothetical protein